MRWRLKSSTSRLFTQLFIQAPKKRSKLRVIGLCVGNSPMTGEFPAQMPSNAENNSIWWRQHMFLCYPCHSSLWISVIYSYFPGPWISINMSSYPYRECHSKDHLVVTSSYIQNGISYTYRVVSLYWIISRVPSLALVHNCNCPKDS